MRLSTVRNRRRGTIMPLMAISFAALCGFTALAVDVGMMAVAKNRLSERGRRRGLDRHAHPQRRHGSRFDDRDDQRANRRGQQSSPRRTVSTHRIDHDLRYLPL